ncbi:16S rRNA (guanine(966)-N(2))-methyltransferase RsmD [Parvularcula sp. ZS-1/3]|uniref:16S rRNA (Guanine(966)-N(2))-methyltransferase RsmD n=1 Tax=Parvularcula mediterranea TaxID=2732508 RepID=A0A7Y3RK93_9PROT|nr:16S rRNA (guanine(966)-N(2))-methyltransferase RsmD [Parvularcula mediterranea]NNU15535.1 16S rRNA (guanine(966)-N(2))-methyltransferase RsmD [Parvularcula mediterranea]
MRIVGGEFRGRKIIAPSGQNTRPTTDRTRESLFNILAHREGLELEGARVLDLFAGSGALGFEAISRGASFCLFVDTDASARGAIRDNVEALQLFGRTRIHRRPADALGAKPAGVGAPFDLCLMDPPYNKGLIDKALAVLSEGGWMAPGALIVAEHARGETFETPEGRMLEETRAFGDTEMSFLNVPPA